MLNVKLDISLVLINLTGRPLLSRLVGVSLSGHVPAILLAHRYPLSITCRLHPCCLSGGAIVWLEVGVVYCQIVAEYVFLRKLLLRPCLHGNLLTAGGDVALAAADVGLSLNAR